MTAGYTLDELMIATMARHLGPEFRVAAGATACSLLAALLAQRTVHPDLAVATSFNVLDGQLLPNLGLGEFAVYRRPRIRTRIADLFDLVHAGPGAIWIHPVQIDQAGNANISCIGPWERPRVALVGARGLPDDTANLEGTFYYLTDHTPRTVVARVDFISGAGHGEGRLCPYGRPRALLTNLGLFTWDGATAALRAVTLHPGVTPETVAERTGFPLQVSPDTPVTPAPSPREVELIRSLDPLGCRKLEFLRGEAAAAHLAAIRQQEEEWLRSL